MLIASTGSFFVYSRVAEPFHSIFINNRLNTNSLVEPISGLELQVQPPFLLYRNQRSVISGFWFYCKEDCVRVHSLLEKLIKKPKASENSNNNNQSHQMAKLPHPQQQQQQQPPLQFMKNQNGGGQKQDVDIFSMLSKAQEDFNNSSAPGPGPQQLNQKFAGMQIVNPPPQKQHQHQPLMKQLSSAMPDITSANVVNFFAAAQLPNGVKSEGQILQSQSKPFIANHPIVPPVQTLDEIEKQHRVSASPPQKIGKLAKMFFDSIFFIKMLILEQRTVHNDFNNLFNSMGQQQQHSSVSPQPVMKLQQPGAFQPQVSNKPNLITPAMFQTTNIVEEKIAQPAPLLHTNNIRPEPLTQNQLIQALNYMLETDPEFIRKVHEAYVKSFNKIVSL